MEFKNFKNFKNRLAQHFAEISSYQLVKEVLYGESKYTGTEKEQMFNELL